MAKNDVKLLGAWPSPYVLRARIALNIKSVKYEFLAETMAPKSELLLQSNPVYKKIPVLIHGDKPICESLVIVQYIDEAWTSGPSILPSDPCDRAIHRFWAVYLDETVRRFSFWWFPSISSLNMYTVILSLVVDFVLLCWTLHAYIMIIIWCDSLLILFSLGGRDLFQ